MSHFSNVTSGPGAKTAGGNLDINSHGPSRDYASSYMSKKGANTVLQSLEPEPEDLDPHSIDRALKGYHVFPISVSGVLGIGLYVRSSDMLRIGGAAAVVIPFIVFTILAWMVMQSISEMLLIGQVSGALRLFVQEFVDKELGIVVAVAYWFTWYLVVAAFIEATAQESREQHRRSTKMSTEV